MVVKNQRGLLGLPKSIFDHLLRYLDPRDIKSLSLTSYRLLSAIENTQEWAPRLHLITIDSALQHKKAIRMIPEVYPGSYLTRPHADDKQQEIISLTCCPTSLPTYNEAQMADWNYAFRFRESKRLGIGIFEPRIWLCPHTGCKYDDIIDLIRQQPNPALPSIYSTTPVLCSFPKCSLWARHALIASQTAPCTYEMCSTIKIYRRQCSSFEEMQSLLQSDKFRKQLLRATNKLKIRICSHLSISSLGVLDTYKFDNVLLCASQSHAEVSQLLSLQEYLDQQCCSACVPWDTYTTWGFVARYTQESGHFWLDIEMMLCRPVFDSGTERWKLTWSQHWRCHSITGLDMVGYGTDWRGWARVVAEDGFDWTVQLPPAFLKHPSRGLLDFPLPVNGKTVRPPRFT